MSRLVGAFRCLDGIAYERPAVMPADPAVVSDENHEKRFVEAQRARGVGWQNIAGQLRRCVLDVRRRHDPRWQG